jgi:putative hemolysin
VAGGRELTLYEWILLMLTTGVILGAIVLVLALTFLATLEMSLGQVNKLSLRLLADKQKNKVSALLKDLVEKRWETLVSLYGGIHLFSISLAIIITLYLHNQYQSYLAALPVAFLIMLFVVMLFRQFIPGLISFLIPEKALLALVPIYIFLRPILWVISFPLSSTIKYMEHSRGEPAEKGEEASEEEIQAFIDVGTEEGILDSGEGKLIQSVVEFGDKMARDIMTPRTAMVSINVNASPANLKKLMQETKYSRLPVFKDQLENIQGIVFLKDLVGIWEEADRMPSIEKLVRPIHFVPESKNLADLLKELQLQASHMAIVVDEYGGVAGLVTIEDILEEIAGEIHDEDEVGEIRQIAKTEKGNYLVPGNTQIRDVEEALQVEISDEDSSTIAGFLNSRFGRVPHKGEKTQYQSLLFEVLEADRRKILSIQITPLSPSPTEE